MNKQIIPARSIQSHSPLTELTLQRVVPSIYADNAHESRTDQYTQIPTADLLASLSNEGFEPFYAAQAGVRDISRYGFAKHVIRFRHRSELEDVTGTMNEIILVNAHDGSSSYRLLSGCFRFVCLNGLISGNTVDEVRIRHRGDIADQVIEGAYRVLKSSSTMTESRLAMAQTRLSEGQQQDFANAALKLRFADLSHAPAAERLLRPVRHADIESDLWTTLNVVHEHLVKGGILGFSQNQRIVRTRAVNAIESQIKLNCGLWSLAEAMIDL